MTDSTQMKKSYSHNDHYKWGFGDAWFNPPQADGFFQVSIGACSRPHKSFREECVIAAKLIAEQFTKPIAVGLSGGFDSQVVCLALKEAGIPFTPVILKLTDSAGKQYNNFDTDAAEEFCKQEGFDPVIEWLDVDDFYVNRAWALIDEYCITVAEIAVQLHLVIKYKDTHAYVNGGGDPVIHRTINEDGTSELTYSLGPTPIQQYLMDHNIEGCIKFFMYTPELIAAYLDHPIVHAYDNAQAAVHGPVEGVNIWMYYIKPMMYVQEWPELVQRRKKTGFENLPYMRKLRQLTHRMNDWINPRAKKVSWSYKELLDHLNSNTGEVKVWRSKDETNYY